MTESHLNNILKDTFFSLNIEEATSDTLRKVLTVLVSYFDIEKQMVVVRHLASVNVPSVNTENVHNALIKIFAEKELPWKNCLAILIDSCAVMLGSKNHLENRIEKPFVPTSLIYMESHVITSTMPANNLHHISTLTFFQVCILISSDLKIKEWC